MISFKRVFQCAKHDFQLMFSLMRESNRRAASNLIQSTACFIVFGNVPSALRTYTVWFQLRDPCPVQVHSAPTIKVGSPFSYLTNPIILYSQFTDYRPYVLTRQKARFGRLSSHKVQRSSYYTRPPDKSSGQLQFYKFIVQYGSYAIISVMVCEY